MLQLSILCLVVFAQADEPSTPRPEPEGLVLADLGKEFKGYRAPVGFRAEGAASKLGEVESFAFDEAGQVVVVRPSAGPATSFSTTIAYKDGTRRVFTLRRPRAATAVLVGPLGGEMKQKFAERLAGNVLPLGKAILYVANGSLIERTDRPKVLVQGLGGEHARLSLAADGWLLIAASEGDHFAEGSDGSRATVLRTGAVFRCRPDGSRLHVFAVGFHDPGAPALDLAGSLFLHDGSVPLEKGFATARLLHVGESVDCGYRLAPGATFDTPDRHRASWIGDRPGLMGPLVKTEAGPASPLCIYADTRLPEAYRGLLFRPDPRNRTLHASRAEADGETFKISQAFNLLAGPKGFRPVQATVGPDGAIYILDAGNGGRLVRLSWVGTREGEALALRSTDSWAKTAAKDDAGLLKALADEEASVREAARRELVRRGDKNRAALLTLLDEGKASLASQFAILGTLQSMADDATLKAFGKVLAEGDPAAQILAASLLGRCAKKGGKIADDLLLRGLGDPDKAVKRTSVLAMARARVPGAADSIARLLSFDDGKSPYFTQGLLASLEILGSQGIDALLALADSGNQKDDNRVAAVFPLLRSPAAFAAIPRLLRNPHLDAMQHEGIVRSTANYVLEGGADLDPIAAQVIKDKEESDRVRIALLEALATPGTRAGPKTAAWALEQLGKKATRDAAIPAVGKLRPARADEVLTSLLDKADRLAILASLRDEALLAKWAEKEPAALRAMARLAPARAAPLARKRLKDEPALAAEVLGQSMAGAIEIAKLVLAGKCDARIEAARSLRRYAVKSEEAAKLLAKLTDRE